MPSLFPLSTLASDLRSAHSFEAAGERLLQSLFEAIVTVLRAKGGDTNARVVRGMIHHRPDDGYRRLWGKAFDSIDPGVATLELPSVTAWRWLARRGCPVSIDVESRILYLYEGGQPRRIRDQSGIQGLGANETCQRLQARAVTYLHAIPLCRPGNLVDGMVAIEMSGSSETGEVVVARSGELLQLLVDLSTPYLAALPSAPAASAPSADPFLPVIGAETAGIVQLLGVFSNLPETILITGPTGVGKSRLARYCHAQSPRRDKPFVTLDLLSCPEHLQLASLTGWKRGAFTGADKDSPGAIHRAEGGTLFIDEIDKLSLQAQAGLLRLLEERVYRPAGDTGEDRRADVRFIVGTNANLRALVESGRFREDLYWRIAVLMVRVPPLNQRLDEIPGWAAFMLSRCVASAQGGGAGDAPTEVRFHAAALAVLGAHSWPGNLRQLDNVVRRAHAYALMAHGPGCSQVVISADQVTRALQEDSTEDPSSREGLRLPRQLRSVARAFAREIKRRELSSKPLSLECTEAFRGLVLEATIQTFGNNRDKAFEALGLGQTLKDRNQHRLIRREQEIVARFLALFE